MTRKLTLNFLTGPIKGQKFSFDEEPEIIIGRIDDCDITLKDPKISSEHCGIFFEDGEYFLEDFESTNGTYVNTTKVTDEEYVLEGGETLFLGSSKISVKITSDNKRSIPKKEDYTSEEDDLDEFEFEEDTNIKRINQKRGFKKFFDIDYYLDLKEKFLALDTVKKSIVIIIVLVAVLILGMIFSKLGSSGRGGGFFHRSYDDDSEKIMSLDDSNLNKLYGYMTAKSGREDYSHPKKIRFKFRASKQEKILITYLSTHIDYLDELIVKLNGVKISKSPLTSDEVMTTKLALPFDNLKFDKEDNILEFINTKNLTAKKYKKWGILLVKFEKRSLPKADIEKAKENYLKAEKLYDQRRISRGNRYKALLYYQAAIDFMELLPDSEKADFYDDCKDKIKRIKKDFDKIYQDNRYAAIRAFKFQRYEEAKLHINNIIEEIPDEDDSRYNNALKMLNAIP